MALLVFFDYQRVQKNFRVLKTILNEIRLATLTNESNLVVSFKGKIISILKYPGLEEIESMKISTLSDVMYDTKLGANTIVFNKGTTSAFNIRIHGGEIVLKSWFGFKKHIHINCAGFIREGTYPEDK